MPRCCCSSFDCSRFLTSFQRLHRHYFNVIMTSVVFYSSQYIPLMFSITAVHLLSVVLFITFILAYQFVLSDDLSKISTCPKLMCNNVKQNISAQGIYYFNCMLDNCLEMHIICFSCSKYSESSIQKSPS